MLIGRGSGLLSGAAIALSPSPLLLPINAAEITKITFRFGLVVDQVCRSSEISPEEINAEGVSGCFFIILMIRHNSKECKLIMIS